MANVSVIPVERIESRILLIRGQKVMLDRHLAELYEVSVKRLNEAVRRNRERFPKDFMFQLTWEEAEALRSQFATLNNTPSKRGKHIKYLPYAFTEQGVAMLSSVLRSKRAVQVNIAIMRTFVKLRRILASNRGLARKLKELEKKYDARLRVVFEAINRLMDEKELPEPEKPKIGFYVKKDKK